jgi:acetolactate synthase-1/2/3 large subunit
MQRLADYVAQFLMRRGVKDIFMLTGYGAMYLNDAFAISGMNFYAARNEGAAPMMAGAYARVKQSLGAVCVTAGPGSTNALPGLAEAYVDSAPIIMISGQVHRKFTTHQANTPGVRTFGTAEINIVPIVQNLTKYAAVVNEPESVRYHLEKAYYCATSGRPGPVWLDIPLDVQEALIDPERLEGFTPSAEPWTETDIRREVRACLDLLLSSKRPVLLCGHGVRQGNAIGEMTALVDALKIPVVCSRLGIDILPHSHPNMMGQIGIKGVLHSNLLMKDADLVISLGCRLAIPLVGHNLESFAPNAKIVMVDLEKGELTKPGVRVDLPIYADVKTFLQEMRRELPSSTPDDVWKQWMESSEKLKNDHPFITSAREKNPIDLYYFMSRMGALSEKRHILVSDAGSNYYVGGQVWHFEKGQREITSGTNAAMGLGIPLAIGASVADKSAQVLATTGDGSLELNIQELKTISHYRLNIKLFVINNGGYASMRNWQDNYFEGRRIDTEESTGAGTLNLKKVAEAFELDYVIIQDHREIDETLRQLISHDRPVFVEVVTDNNQEILEPIEA